MIYNFLEMLLHFEMLNQFYELFVVVMTDNSIKLPDIFLTDHTVVPFDNLTNIRHAWRPRSVLEKVSPRH